MLIYVRCTEDWHNYSCASLLFKAGKRLNTGIFISHELAKTLVEKIEAWDRAFNIRYFEYRTMLKSIAEETYGNNKVYYDLEELDVAVKEDDLICPCDDDDWFRPDIAQTLPKYMQGIDLLYWDQVIQITHEFGPHRWKQYHSGIASNNYCITGSAFKSMNKASRHTVLNDHAKVREICSNNNLVMKEVSDLMSCYVWTIGSVSFMKDRNVEDFYKKIRNHSIKEDSMKWTQKYYDKLVKIHNKLGKEIKCL